MISIGSACRHVDIYLGMRPSVPSDPRRVPTARRGWPWYRQEPRRSFVRGSNKPATTPAAHAETDAVARTAKQAGQRREIKPMRSQFIIAQISYRRFSARERKSLARNNKTRL